MRSKTDKKGFMMVEALIAVSIALVVILTLMAVFTALLRISLNNLNKTKATYLSEEALEVARIFRDQSWSGSLGAMATNTPIYINFNSTAWATTTSNIFVDSLFERKIYIYDVYRDASNNISSSGTYDPNTKKVKAQIAWQTQEGTTTRTMSTYITNLFRN